MMTEETGRILWTNESKHYLLRLIRENPIIISPNVSSETMQKKELAWMCIEKCFASDGLVCQLGKIKRLWKRMKDNARQNTMKSGEQRKRGIKHVRPPSDLDWQVHQLLATRNDLLQQSYKAKKDKKKQQPNSRLHSNMDPNAATGGLASASSSGHNGDETEGSVRMSTWTGMHPLQHSLADSEDDCDDGMAEDDDDCVDLVDLLTPVQTDNHIYQNHQQRQHQHQAQDALEPMTIIEEMMEPIKIEPMQDLTLDDDDDDDDADAEPNDEYTFHQQQHSGPQMPNGCEGASEDTRDDRNEGLRTLKRDLLLLDIKLRQTQRQYENERMSHERQLFRKRTQLLDLQIRRAELEVRHVQRSNIHDQPASPLAENAAGNSADDQ